MFEGGIPMLLDVSDALRNQGQTYSFTHHEHLDEQEILGDTVYFDDPLLLSGSYVANEGSVNLQGKLEFCAHAKCARCLEPVSMQFSVPFAEQFIRKGSKGTGTNNEEDDELQFFEGYQIDLQNLALSLALLELPIKFLCKEDCQGLQYEQNHEEANACQEALNEHPFAALQKMLTKDQEV